MKASAPAPAPAPAPTSTVVGYARVLTITQTLEQQTEQLTAAGAGKIFSDVMSGARDDPRGADHLVGAALCAAASPVLAAAEQPTCHACRLALRSAAPKPVKEKPHDVALVPR